MSRERAELSKKNPYHIPRYRYYELKYFCRQYDDWKKALTLIDGWQTSPNDISGIIKGCPPVSQTERIALSRVFYSSCMRLQKIGVSTITLLKDEMFFRMAMKFGSTLHWNLGYQCYG